MEFESAREGWTMLKLHTAQGLILYPLQLDCKRDYSAEPGINVAKGDTIDETKNTSSDPPTQKVRVSWNLSKEL